MKKLFPFILYVAVLVAICVVNKCYGQTEDRLLWPKAIYNEGRIYFMFKDGRQDSIECWGHFYDKEPYIDSANFGKMQAGSGVWIEHWNGDSVYLMGTSKEPYWIFGDFLRIVRDGRQFDSLKAANHIK